MRDAGRLSRLEAIELLGDRDHDRVSPSCSHRPHAVERLPTTSRPRPRQAARSAPARSGPMITRGVRSGNRGTDLGCCRRSGCAWS